MAPATPTRPTRASPKQGAIFGLAVRFALPCGQTAEWGALSLLDFPARKPQDFTGLAGAQKKGLPSGLPNPARIVTYLATHQHKLLPPQYLISELKLRVQRAPVAWDLVFEMAEPGDPLDDMTKHWPDDRLLVTAGRLTLGRLHEDQDLIDRSMFDPTKVPAGIECSDDPVLHFRSESYIESQKRRHAETKPAITPG